MKKPEELVGQTVDNYLIADYLAQGDMTDVYLAVDQNLNRQVAFKVLLPENLSDPDVVERFRREAIAGGKLVHPNIIQMYGVGTMPDNRPYITAQYVIGGSLERRLWDMNLAGERFEIEEALILARQVADALGAAHKQGIVHRDVATSNILIKFDLSDK